MKPRLDLLQLGDLGFTLPAAAAIAAALVASRAGRHALRWCMLFTGGMLAVGLNKIAFMAWGAGIDVLAFKAASGHAASATAVLPLLVYLAVLFLRALDRPMQAAVPQRYRCVARPPGAPDSHAGRTRHASMAAGIAIGVTVAVQLVLQCEHTLAEALAGCAVGAAIAWAALGRTAPERLRPAASAICFGAVFLCAAYLTNSLHVAYWMVRAARLLVGGQPLHDLGID